MCSSAPCLVSQLWLVLYDFDESLHASLYLYELEFAPSGVSLHRFYVEHDLQVRSNSEVCFRVSQMDVIQTRNIVHLVSGITLGEHQLLYEFPWR